MRTTATVAVVGAGASGTLCAAHLARTAAAAGRRLDILLVDPRPVGRGLAYSTNDPRHRLNVAAKGMSAWPEHPQHFLRWLRRHVAVDFPAGGFAPRLHFGDYLADVLASSAAPAGPGDGGNPVRVEHLALRATDVRSHGRRLRVTLDDGTSRPVDVVVLATGYGEPDVAWAPEELRRSPAFVPDPWCPSATTTPGDVRADDEVVLVGAGLTAVDMAMRWGKEGVRVHLVSRHGLAPLPHATEPSTPVPCADEDLPRTAAAVRRFVFAAVRAAGGDWRAAVDGLRPLTARLWQALPAHERAILAAGDARRWDRVRHRIDPAVGDWLDERRADETLIEHTAAVTSAEATARGVRVGLSDATTVDAAAVINCTGASGDVSRSADPLLMNLLERGLAQPGPLNLGFATDGAGRLRPVGADPLPIWTLGPLRRGELWESTAVPEIRSQAAELARVVIAGLPAPRLVRRPRDPYGLPLSASAEGAAAYVAALGRILRVQSGAESLVTAAVRHDPGFALGHAALALLGVEWGAPVDVTRSLERAEAAAGRADERERAFIDVAAQRVRHPGGDSAAALLNYIRAYPEDAFAVSLAVPTIAFGGATEIPAEAWALVEGLAPAYRDDWWYLGMLAFVRQDQDRYAEADELASRALRREPASAHAAHAKAHVDYETGDHRRGLAWLDRWIDAQGERTAHRAHFSWHAALHELSLGDDAAVAARYAGQLAPPQVAGVRGLVDSASLLWRCRLLGVATASDAIAGVLRGVPRGLLHEPPTPFVAMHAAIALAAVEDCRSLAALRRWASHHPDATFTEIIAPLADALCELTHGDADRAVDTLVGVSGLTRLGGSAAQREIIEETLLYAAAQAGQHGLASSLLAQRLERRESPRDRSRLRQLVHAELRRD